MTRTPEHIVICIHTIAARLGLQQYGYAIISPSGGASFHQRSVFDKKAELFAEITRLEEMTAQLDARAQQAERERDALRHTLTRIRFLLGGHSDTVDDCDDAAIRDNATKALDRARAALAARAPEGDTPHGAP